MLDPALLAFIKEAATVGFLTICGAMVCWILYLCVLWLRTHMQNIEGERQGVAHDARAASEHLAHIAEEGFQFAMHGSKTAAERGHELANGGPGTSPKEQTLLLWEIRESVGRLDGKVDGLAGRVSRLEDSNVRIETRLGIGDVKFDDFSGRIGRLEQAGGGE